MAKSGSTRFKDLRGRPLDYRTPSPPPRSAIEDIPPLTPPTQGIFNTSFVRTKLNGRAKRGAEDSRKRPNYRTPSPPPRSAIEAISPLTSARSTAAASTSDVKTKNRRIAQSVRKGQSRHGGRERTERRGVQDGSRWNTKGGGDETEGEDEPYAVSKEDGSRLAMANSLPPIKNGVDYHTNAQTTHQFSSAMDAIATIAMATSPTFGPQSHQLPSAFLQSQYPSQYPTSQFLQPSLHHSPPTHTWPEERPAKRARPDNPPEGPAHENQQPQISYNNPAVWAQNHSQQAAWDDNTGSAMSLSQRRRTTVTDSEAELLLNVGRVAVFAKPQPIEQSESNENGRPDIAFVGRPGNSTASCLENSSFRSADKFAEGRLAIHRQSNTIGTNGINPTPREAQGLDGTPSSWVQSDPGLSHVAVAGSYEEQDLPNLPKSGVPLEANGAAGASLAGDQGTAQERHFRSPSRAVSPMTVNQRTRQEDSSQQVEVGGDAPKPATRPEHELHDTIPTSSSLGNDTIDVEIKKVEAVPLPRESGTKVYTAGTPPLHPEHGMVGSTDTASAGAVALPKDNSLVDNAGVASTETIFSPQERDEVKATLIADVPLPQERNVIDDVQTTPAGAVPIPKECGVIENVEAPPTEVVHLSQGHDRISTAETPPANAVPFLGEREVIDIVQVASSSASGLQQKYGRAASVEDASAGAVTLPQESQTISGAEAGTGRTDSSGAEQHTLVDASVEIHRRAGTPQEPTEFPEPDREAPPSPVLDIEGAVGPKTQNARDDGGKGFIQELREYVKRSTGEVRAQDAEAPTVEITPGTDLPEDGNLMVKDQTDVAGSVPVQLSPTESSRMVRDESQSSESRNSSKQPRRGWPKGKPRGPRSSWPGVIKAKEGIRAGSSSRANRSAGRKENQIEGPIGSEQLTQKKQRTRVTDKKSIEDAQHEIPRANHRRRAEDINGVYSNASFGTKSHNIAECYPSSSDKGTLLPPQDALSGHGSSPPLPGSYRDSAGMSASASLQDPAMAPANGRHVPQQAIVTVSPPGASDSSEVQSSIAGTDAPTLAQTSANRQPLGHRYSAPDMLIDPLTNAPPSGSQGVGHTNRPPLARAPPTPLGYSPGFTGQNSETRENALGRRGTGVEAEQSICAGCSMLPNSLGGDSYLETVSWIKCDGCKRWFHYACAGFTEKEVRSVDKFNCPACWEKCGPTTFVRKSSRAHTSIDYAGLHEGVVKTSEESLDHPYVRPIKDGTIKFLPESFTRLRPGLATREFFEKYGMKEPIIIPGSMNPRPETAPDVDKLCWDHSEGESQVFIKQAIDYWLAGDFDKLHGPNHGQDAMDMVIPQNLTVRKVAQLYGPGEKVEVINVKSQGEDGPWNMKKWADYYESRDKQFIRNVISLEISTSELGRLVKRPQVVRDMDLADSVWPAELRAKGDFPKVQLYCLMSVENSFTDFHIDFGGSSVFYHILKGRKTFLFIPPKPKHLKKYEQWCLSPAQNQTFLPDQTKECIRVDLAAGDTMLIPSGWIHAVWTPEDSLVIGGNFLTRMHYGMQISIAEIEKATKVPRKFRYPSFQRVLWFTAIRYLQDDPIPTSLVERFNDGEVYKREVPLYQSFNGWGANAMGNPEAYNARHYSQSELDGLPSLVGYLLRSALVSMGKITEGITVDIRQRVARAMPKGYGEPLELAKTFAMWSAWKRGNEMIPHWAYRDAIPGEGIAGVGEKKLSAAAAKRLEREAAAQEKNAAPGRQSMRKRAQIEAAALNEAKSTTPEFAASPPLTAAARKTLKPPSKVVGEKWARATTASGLRLGDVDGNLAPIKPVKTPKTSVLGPKRVACDECRKRRVRCKHKDLLDPDEPEVEESSKTRNTTPKSEAYRDAAHPPQSLTETKSLNRSPTGSDFQQAQPPSITLGPPFDSLISHQPTPASTVSTTSAPSGPGGKHRACEKCRKNRRRCIHDGNGNVDPIKAQEPPMPRASSVNKRARPVVGLDTNRYFKKTKTEPEISNGLDNISEGPTDIIRVRPTIPDPLRSFDVSKQHVPRGQRPISGSTDRRALDTEQRHPRVPMVLSGAWEYRPRQETISKPPQPIPSVSTILVDASERQLLREEAYRIDKEVSAEGTVQAIIQNGAAAPRPKPEPQVIAPTLSLASHMISNRNFDLLDTVQLVSTSPVPLAPSAAATAKANLDNAVNQLNSTGRWGGSGEIASLVGGEHGQIITGRMETALTTPDRQEMQGLGVGADRMVIEMERAEPKREEIDMELIDPQLRGLQIEPIRQGPGELEADHTPSGGMVMETIKAEPEHREMEANQVEQERVMVGITQSVLENLGLTIGQVGFEQGETGAKPVDPGRREEEGGSSTTSGHDKMEMDQIEPESTGKGEEQIGNGHMDVGPVDSHQQEPKLPNEGIQNESTSPDRMRQDSPQPGHGATEHANAERTKCRQSHSTQMELDPVDLSGVEVEQSSSDKMEFELDSSIDDLSSPPDSPLSELDISSPEPDPETKSEPGTTRESQSKPKPQAKKVVPKSLPLPQEQERRRSKRETKEVQRFSAVGPIGIHNKHRPNEREASRTPAPPTSHKSMSPNLEFPSPGRTYARKPGRPVITPCKTAPLSRPGSIFAVGDDASLVVQGAVRGKPLFPEVESAADEEEKASEVDEESWRLAKEMEFGLRRKGLK
ncbi:MAG: JmjC domain-containing histone demethylation protein 1 [Geoglossum umbratile]|nr:MAG: JmjC domain-containing histone demethylation protein 1 [Geoglossum umbratile]